MMARHPEFVGQEVRRQGGTSRAKKKKKTRKNDDNMENDDIPMIKSYFTTA